MLYRFDFRPYQRQFKRALSTSHGKWEIREGVIIRLTDEMGQIGWGEIAPISWFGSETWEEAVNFCCQIGDEITAETIFSIPSELPACQFGFESAWSRLNKEHTLKYDFSYSGLLPAGEAALQEWQTLWQQGYRTFKWKIAVNPIEDELEIFQQLIQTLPAEAKLRLDPNGGLSWEEANQWLKICDRFPVEFLEQPLPVDGFDAMLELSHRYSTPLALDESVATINQLQNCYKKGWRSIFVIKPCIAGSPQLLRKFCQQHDLDVVFSSVFETAIGRQAALNLAGEISRRDRAIGFGVNHWFDRDEESWLKNLWNNH